MVVEQNVKAEFLSGLRERNRVFQIIGQLLGRMEKPQAHPVVSVIPQDFEDRLRFAAVFEYATAILGRLRERNVRANRVF